MSVAAEYRIPHSEFLSWSDADRDKAIWWHLRERATCNRCGTRPEEWDVTDGGHRHAYTADEQICRGCQVLEAGQERAGSDPGNEKVRGLHIVLKPREDTKEAAPDG